MAARAGAGLHLVHVSTDPRAHFVLGTSEEHLLAPERKALTEAAAALRENDGIAVEGELYAGPIADAITAAAERVVATAIVVAGRRRLAPRLGRNVTERLARQARVPVLVLRAPEAFEAWLRGERPLHVMVGSDLGAASTRALRFASGELARMGPVEVTVACVAAPDETSIRLGLPLPSGGAALLPAAEAALRRELADQVQAAGVSSPARVLVQAGTAAPETHLSVLAENEQADLLIVGTRRHSWVEQIWYGSVSRGVLRAASTNIACIPRLLVEDKPAVPSAPRVIVAATDLSPLGDAAVPLAYGLVTGGGTVHLTHVVDAGPLARPGERLRDAELVNQLAERIPPDAAAKGVRTECHVVFGRAAEEVVALADRVGASVICVGSRGRSGVGAAVLGSVSQEIIARSRCPVTVVPEPRE
jgi:nucleotide-binding universal stress UspA family protein